MSTAEKSALDGAIPSGPPSICGDWSLYEFPVVTSTNLVARNLPAWSAVRADTQTAGRGRFQRAWVSDQGGLWLSAVVPAGADKTSQRALPLLAGLSVSRVLSELGVSKVRLRWPNDVLVGDRKLAGLLIDQFIPGRAVIGLGVNVRNRPEVWDPGLANRTTRLVDLAPTTPTLTDLTGQVLRHLRQTLIDLDREGGPALLARVNLLWGPPRAVELDLDGTIRRGQFRGVDPEGRLRLEDKSGSMIFYEAHQVRHLAEI
jgi:BirA family transcriptional regulator, biotin operon repressor / biotin---[acetyl-CoA-carboxylase] ligase